MLLVNIQSPWDGSITECSVEFTEYANGHGVAVQLYDVKDQLPFAKVSVNVQGIALAKNEFIFKNYGENEGMLRPFLESKIVKLTGKEAIVGRVLCPIVQVRKFR